MGIRILQIPINYAELEDWLNNKGFINLGNEAYLSSKIVAQFYDEDLQKYYKRHRNESYYTFDEWRKREYTILTKSELDLYYGSDNWHYEVIEGDDFLPRWLVVALIDKVITIENN